MDNGYKKILFTIVSLVAIIGYGYFVYAAAPNGGYTPGSTLDPDCAPGDTDCIVALPLSGGVAIGDVVGNNPDQNGILYTDATGQVTTDPLFTRDALTKGTNILRTYTDSFSKNWTAGFSNLQDIGTGFPGTGLSANDDIGNSVNISILDGSAYSIDSGLFNIQATDAAGNNNAFIGYAQGGQWSIENSTTNASSSIGMGSSTINMLVNDGAPNIDYGFNISSGYVMWRYGDNYYRLPSSLPSVGQVLGVSAIFGNTTQLDWINSSSGSGWSITGNTGTTAGVDFIGTTDAQDFMVKTNGNQIALFGQDGNVAVGSEFPLYSLATPSATGLHSFAFGPASLASGIVSTAFFNSVSSGDASFAALGGVSSGTNSLAFGGTASGLGSVTFGALSSGTNSFSFSNGEASGESAVAWGYEMKSPSFGETSFGQYGVNYIPVGGDSIYEISDRLFSIGNGKNSSFTNNAYTLWKDGSFAYNDDNFQNDTPGTEQNMFYFNYGNHDGLGNSQSKRAIRLGSTVNDEWDINSLNVGNKSVVIGFGGGIASGENTFVFGNAKAEGNDSVAFNGGYAQGTQSFAWGKNAIAADDSFAFSTGSSATASGNESWALGNSVIASGDYSKSIGLGTISSSFAEIALGTYNTNYISNDPQSWNYNDRLFVIGNGTSNNVSESDVLTILKNGETGIGIDNFETYTNGSIFQVGDGGTNIIGYVDNSTGNWVNVSDERKKENITDLSYGLNEVLQLRPTSFNYKRNGEHTIGFLAQQVLPIIPEAVYGTESEGYGMSYTTLTPVLVKAIQEMNLKITDIGNTETPNTWRDALIAWFESTTNGIRKLFVGEVHTDTLCIGQTCVTESQLQQLLQNNQQVIIPSSSGNQPSDSDPISTSDDTVVPPDTTELVIDSNPVSDTGSNTTDSGDTPTE